MRKGQKHTEETKRKISKTKKGKQMGKLNHFYGKKHTEESLKRMSKSHKGIIPSEETRRKMSKSHKGKKHTEETLKKMRGRIPWMKGKTHSEEHKKKMSERMKGNTHRKGHTPWMKGKKHTEEARNKMSKAHKGKKLSEEHRNSLKGRVPWNIGLPSTFKGKKHTEEAKMKIRLARSRQILPKKDSSIEIKIQMFLKMLGIPFFTHQYMKIDFGYQCDILIPSMNLVIECDGDYWHNYPIGTYKDHVRTEQLIEKGFKVLRLWECDIHKMDVDSFKDKLDSKNSDK